MYLLNAKENVLVPLLKRVTCPILKTPRDTLLQSTVDTFWFQDISEHPIRAKCNHKDTYRETDTLSILVHEMCHHMYKGNCLPLNYG